MRPYCHTRLWIVLIMKLWIYETHIFELWNEEISVKKILAVIKATYAVAKRKPEKKRKKAWKKSGLPGFEPWPLRYRYRRALHRYRRGQGANPGKPDFFFFRLSFRNCISCFNNCEDLLYTYLYWLFYKYSINFIRLVMLWTERQTSYNGYLSEWLKIRNGCNLF